MSDLHSPGRRTVSHDCTSFARRSSAGERQKGDWKYYTIVVEREAAALGARTLSAGMTRRHDGGWPTESA